MTHPLLKDHAWLIRQYVDEGQSSVEIADELGVKAQSVQYQLRRAGVKMRGRHSDRWNPKTCPSCGSSFTPSGPAAIFCSDRCRNGTGQCEVCGSEFEKHPSKKNLFCSRACKHAAMSSPTGTRKATVYGYVMVKVPHGTPGCEGDRQWMREHRYVMQQALGRPLLDTETVHHINGDKTDNRLENLQLRQGRHGKGARFVCLDCGSHNVEAANL
jgi:hypothetical protein